MIYAQDFIAAALARGYSFFSGVPCSFLKPLINYVIGRPGLDYIAAASEGEACGVASGAYLAGKKTVLMCQNSGLGNMVNPLTSLNYSFRIPALLIVTLRGELSLNDEPQHELMGRITEKLLEAMGIAWEYFPAAREDIEPFFQRAEAYMQREELPYALVMKKGAVAGSDQVKEGACLPKAEGKISGPAKFNETERLARIDAIGIIRGALSPRNALIATTGKIGRELYTLGDSENQLYVVGSMGCAAAIGFGVQRVLLRQRVVVLDGDGAVLMKMGALATIGHYRPQRLLHIILDNESYCSTGGQRTVSPTVDFCRVAVGCGYTHASRAATRRELEDALTLSLEQDGPVLIHLKVLPGSIKELGRPKIKPPQVKERFMEFLQKNASLAL